MALESQFEPMIQGLLDQQFGHCTRFVDASLEKALREDLLGQLEQGRMKPAGIGQHFNYEKNLKVRGDLISWLDKGNNAVQRAFLEQVEAFIRYLNESCYTGIRDCEFHYAYYAAGSFYQRHRDQFKTDHGRKFSLVTYLNENWLPPDGGQLRLYTDTELIEIQPLGGSAVFFKSDELEHEVLPATRPRMSIAGWLKV